MPPVDRRDITLFGELELHGLGQVGGMAGHALALLHFRGNEARSGFHAAVYLHAQFLGRDATCLRGSCGTEHEGLVSASSVSAYIKLGLCR